MVSTPKDNKEKRENKTFYENEKGRYLSQKELRAKIILSRENSIRKVNNNIYLVQSQTGHGWYKVQWNGKEWACNCPDYVKNGHIGPCKHLLALKIRYETGFYESEDVLKDVISFFCKHTAVKEDELSKHIYDAVTIFFYMKRFFVKFLRKISPKAVLIRCGYGRFHMALSQACKELGIPSIELQHGNITKYHVGYVKGSSSDNKDCIPEYLLTYGDVFSDIIRKGNLFEPDNVISIGFPYMDEVKKSNPSVDKEVKNFVSKFSNTLLVTSQWTVADEIKNFVISISKELENTNQSIGIIFKPHPRDTNDYSDMKTYQNIFLADKYRDIYELFQVIDIHSTVYSTSAIESLAFGKPNMFLDVGMNIQDMFEIIDNKSSFLLNSPKQFIERLENIISQYNAVSKTAYKASEKFYKPDAKKNFEEFLNSIDIRIRDKSF